MKNLVLSAILLAGATALTGCVAAGEGDVQASWALKSTNLSAGGAIIAAPCPVGGDTVLINAMDSTGFVYTDAYFCTDGVGIADRLPEDIYTVWVQITSNNGATKFAESSAQLVDVRDGLLTPVTFDVFTDRAFFQASWQLTAPGTGAPTTCAAAGATNMSVLATVAGGSNGFEDDLVLCSAGEGANIAYTGTPVPLGSAYTVRLEALNGNGEGLGNSAPTTGHQFGFGNEYLNLGRVTIPLD
jgi:hypothetical protein